MPTPAPYARHAARVQRPSAQAVVASFVVLALLTLAVGVVIGLIILAVTA